MTDFIINKSLISCTFYTLFFCHINVYQALPINKLYDLYLSIGGSLKQSALRQTLLVIEESTLL